MNENGNRQLITEFLFRFKVALANRRLYPPSSSLFLQSLDALYLPAAKLLEKDESLEINQYDREILVNGKAFRPAGLDQSRQEALFFIASLMGEMQIENITFHRGLEPEELKGFLTILSRHKYESRSGEEEFALEVKRSQISHITVNSRIYRPVEKKSSDQTLKDIIPLLDEVSQLHFPGASGKARDEIKSGIARKAGRLDTDSLVQKLKDENFRKEVVNKISSSIPPSRLKESLIRLGGIYKSLKEYPPQGLKSEELTAIKSLVNFILDSFKESDIAGEISGWFINGEMEDFISPPPGFSEKETSAAVLLAREIIEAGSHDLVQPQTAQKLPGLFKELKEEGQKEPAAELARKISEAVQSASLSIRSSAVELFNRLIPSMQSMPVNIAGPVFVVLREKLDTETDPELYRKISLILARRAGQDIRRKNYGNTRAAIKTVYAHTKNKLPNFVKRKKFAAEALEEIIRDGGDDTLIQDLRSGDLNLRKEALETLKELGEFMIPRLVKEIKNSPEFIHRQMIASILNGIGPGSCIYLSGEIEKESSTAKLIRMVQVLPSFTDSAFAFECLKKSLTHDDRRVRVEAVLTMPRIKLDKDKKGKELLRLLTDPDDLVRREVIKMLGEIRYGPALEPLMDIVSPGGILKRPHPDMIRQAACMALASIKDPRALKTLADIAGVSCWDKLKGEKDSMVKISAIQALKSFRGREAERALKKALKSKDAYVRDSARAALKDYGPEKVS